MSFLTFPFFFLIRREGWKDIMKGVLFALLGGMFITIQNIANAHIREDIGIWQTASITQFSGFLLAALILYASRDIKWKSIGSVNPIYWFGGAFAAFILFSNMEAILQIGVTFTVSFVLISQLIITFIIDINGWFGIKKRNLKIADILGIVMMIGGLLLLKL